MSARQAPGPGPNDAPFRVGFSALALIFYALGRGLVPDPLRAGLDALALLAVIAEIGGMLWRPTLQNLTDHLLALLAIGAAVAMLWGTTGTPAPGLSRFQAWPLFLLCLTIWLPRLTTQAPQPRDGVVLGTALTLGLATLSSLIAPALLPYMLKTPVHLCLWLTFLSALSLTVTASLAGHWTPRTERFATVLSSLLPLLGFFGTIFGLMTALSALPEIFAGGTPDGPALTEMLRGLGSAFETTLIGLGGAMVLTLVETFVPQADREADRETEQDAAQD
ncbi:MotA/TolQ/ExbB proton channel family protein [Celeribacter sp.]|uniref:MotA/TolQ/ExbB proton channel family protein n=1 Tax=Celeribacter sp. TaxID=1890673 RepID=UPI003A922CF4